ncbi:GNAT family N-acetyltransferase [Pseudarthrobacter sp. J1738]|uniref:GNAT family N-acetyltransferase n=1 Tax=unclassified Pseudarthrobacter TaxID=2647000 RepID=UPI003D296CA3
MTLDAGSADIIQLAWARHLGFDDGAFAAATSSSARRSHLAVAGSGARPAVRLWREDPAARELSFLRLFGVAALTGPAWALEAASDFSDEQLADHGTLLSVSRRANGHGGGTSALFFADDLPLQQTAEELEVSHSPEDFQRLETSCPPDDVNEVHGALNSGAGDAASWNASSSTVSWAAGHTSFYTVINEGVPLGAGAFSEWEGLLASMAVLVAPDWRQQGLGTVVASIAAHEALAGGLTLQCIADVTNTGALALARSLGFAAGGTQTTVKLGQ